MEQQKIAEHRVRPGEPYSIPDSLPLEGDDLTEARHAMDILIKSSGGWPVTASTVLHALANQAHIGRTRKPELDRNWAAEWRAEQLRRAWHQANYVHAEWATGDATEFDEWTNEHEADYDTVRKLAEMDGAQDVHAGDVPAYEGKYGYTVAVIGCVVALYDTEGNALLVPWTADVPEVEDYAEIPTCAYSYGGGCGETHDLCPECGMCRDHCYGCETD